MGQTLLSGHSDSLGLLGLNLPDVLATRASAAGGYGSGRSPIKGSAFEVVTPPPSYEPPDK